MSEKLREALEHLENRACGFDARTSSIYTGDILAAELRWHLKEIRAALAAEEESGAKSRLKAARDAWDKSDWDALYHALKPTSPSPKSDTP